MHSTCEGVYNYEGGSNEGPPDAGEGALASELRVIRFKVVPKTCCMTLSKLPFTSSLRPYNEGTGLSSPSSVPAQISSSQGHECMPITCVHTA